MAQFGDRLRAGIDIAGFSDFETSLEDEGASSIDYWRAEYGDERQRSNPAIPPFDLALDPRRPDQEAITCYSCQKLPVRENWRGRPDRLRSP